MHYLINPIWFYLIEVCDTIKTFIFVMIVICGLAMVVMFASSVIDEYFGYVKENSICRKTFKPFMIIVCILSIVFCILPSEETCVKMMVSSQVTSENIEKVEKTIQDSVDYIFDKLDSNKEEQNEKY